MLSPKEGRVLPFTRQATLNGFSNALSTSLAIDAVFHCVPVSSLGQRPFQSQWEA